MLKSGKLFFLSLYIVKKPTAVKVYNLLPDLIVPSAEEKRISVTEILYIKKLLPLSIKQDSYAPVKAYH